MQFEGQQVNIPIKGIMRAGTDNVAADGAMQEVIGMEFKDGSWLPYKEAEETVEVLKPQLHHGVTEWVPVNVTNTWVHKISDTTTVSLFLDDENNLYEETSRYTEDNVQTIKVQIVTSNVKDVSFIGNVLCVSTEEGMKFYLREVNRYIRQNNIFPKVSFRTDIGFEYAQNHDIGVAYFESRAFSNTPKHTSLIYSGIVAALGELRNRGGLSGYIMVRYAFRLKNGEYVNASSPILLCPPMDKAGTYVNGYKDLRSDNLGDNFGTSESPDYLYYQGANGGDGTKHALILKYIDGYESKYDTSLLEKEFSTIRYHEGKCYVDSERTGWKYFLVPIVGDESSGVDKLSCYAPPLRVTYGQGMSGNDVVSEAFTTFALGGCLQYKIGGVNTVSESIIDSICIFISQEVSPFKLLEENEMDDGSIYIVGNRIKNHSDTSFMTSIGVPKKTAEEITEELNEIKDFYLVKEIKLAAATDSEDWETVDLKGKLGDNLVVREQMPLTASDKSTTIPNSLSAYNYRLHAYDYIQRLFEGSPIDEFAHHGGTGQEAEAVLDTDEYKWEIKVTLKDESGNSTLVTYSDESVDEIITSLTPILSYPSIYATSMVIRVYNVDDNTTWYEKTFALSSNENIGISSYIDPNLKPIDIATAATGAFPSSIPAFQPSNDTRPYTNGMRVSDVAYPMYFPANLTYRFGNGKILGLARLTIPVSQDNTGRSKLVVFCTDGIYWVDVDSSGNGAYTNQSLASPEVCVNPNSICEIGGAVFFAGDKGLMVLTGESAVQMYNPEINGEPRFLPADTQSKEAHGIYKKMIDSPSILSKDGDAFDDSISRSDFVDFIKDNDTHIVYISNKNKLLAFNENKDYSYFIDIPTHNATKLAMSAMCEDGQLLDRKMWERVGEAGSESYIVHSFGFLSQTDGDIPSMVLSRPIKVRQDDKCSYRVVLSGYFEGETGNWADLIVLGSLDGDHWRVIGVKEKKLYGGFHNLGCLTERGSWKYLMFIFGGKLSNNSHIDSVDITVDGRYNNKKR